MPRECQNCTIPPEDRCSSQPDAIITCQKRMKRKGTCPGGVQETCDLLYGPLIRPEAQVEDKVPKSDLNLYYLLKDDPALPPEITRSEAQRDWLNNEVDGYKFEYYGKTYYINPQGDIVPLD